MTSKRVLALGECMVELAPAGDGLYRRGFAGDTYNFAWYLRRLLAPEWAVGYGTWLGTDAVSDEMFAAIEREGIETVSIRRTEQRTVGLYMIEVRDGERSFTYWRSQSAARLLASDGAWLEEQLRGAALVLFSGITLAVVEPGHRATLLAALARARRRGTVIAFDPNLRPRLWPDTLTMCTAISRAAEVADIALPSFDDERHHFGDATTSATLERYRGAGARTVVVKNGGDAIDAWDAAEGAAGFRPPVVPVVDTTAAGDSFNGGFLAARLRGAELAESLGEGARLAAVVVEHSGALVAAAVAAGPPQGERRCKSRQH
jgi:2-dehydro-3-deoxygluconokinase